MKIHRGINITSVAGEGLNGITGVLITVAFVFLFAGIFVPKTTWWFVPVFLAVETAATVLYVCCTRRSRRESDQLSRELHKINDGQLRSMRLQ